MKTVTLNISVDEYANRVLEVTKAVYGLSNKSEAFNKLVRDFGPKILEPELREEFIREVLSGTKEWERKHAFKRKMSLAKLDAL